MYLIKDKSGRYLKLTVDNKITFTANESLADVFSSEREATDFIRKAFKKKSRRNYKAVQCGSNFVSDLTSYYTAKQEEITDRYTQGIENLNKAIDTYLTPEVEKYKTQVHEYDEMTLDILHFIRDKNTHLNACQGYEVFKKLQMIGRERETCKKEYQRVAMLKASVLQGIKDSENFEYEEYKNRRIDDVAEFLFGN